MNNKNPPKKKPFINVDASTLDIAWNPGTKKNKTTVEENKNNSETKNLLNIEDNKSD